MGGQRHAPAPLPLHETEPTLNLREDGWAPGQVWYAAENLAPTGI